VTILRCWYQLFYHLRFSVHCVQRWPLGEFGKTRLHR